MKITNIKAEFGATFQADPLSDVSKPVKFVRFQSFAEATLEAGDDADKCIKQLYSQLKIGVKEQWEDMRKNQEVSVLKKEKSIEDRIKEKKLSLNNQ